MTWGILARLSPFYAVWNLSQDREKLIQEKYPRPEKWAAKFVKLAEKNPREPWAGS